MLRRDWSSEVCSSDLTLLSGKAAKVRKQTVKADHDIHQSNLASCQWEDYPVYQCECPMALPIYPVFSTKVFLDIVAQANVVNSNSTRTYEFSARSASDRNEIGLLQRNGTWQTSSSFCWNSAPSLGANCLVSISNI